MNRMQLDEILKKNEPIYVRNITRPRAQIMLQFVLGNGKSYGIKIPRTVLPICLNDHVPPDVIAKSHDIRAYLTKRILELVPMEEAEKILNDPANRDELETLRTSEFSAKSTFTSDRVNQMEKAINQSTPDALEVQGIQTDSITPRVLSVIAQVESGDLQIKAALQELKILESELTAIDCSYIISKGPDGQLKSFAQTVLSRFSTGNEVKVVKSPAPINATMAGPNSGDDDADLSPEEKAQEARREAAARANQAV